ncbi:MAG: phage portal protein [bacterium JZ-2024 1]
MNLFQWITRRFRGDSAPQSPHKSPSGGPSFLTRSFPVSDTTEISSGLHTLLRSYEASIWVYACVHCISANASRAEIRVLRGDTDAPENHPLRLLLQHPSEDLTLADLLERTIADYLLAGIACWRLDGGSPPLALTPLPPDRIAFVRGAWEYREGARTFRYPRSRILTFRAYAPIPDGLAGISPIRPLLPTLATDLQVISYLRDFFRKGTLIRGYFYAEQELTEDALARLRNEIMESYRGAESFFRPPVLSGGLEYRPLAPAPVDLAFQGWREELRKDILAAFRVPPILLGLDTANFATAREQKATFWNKTIMPLLKKFEARINLRVVAPYADALREPLALRFVPPSDTSEAP